MPKYLCGCCMKSYPAPSHSGNFVCPRCGVGLLLADEGQYNPRAARAPIHQGPPPLAPGPETRTALKLASLQIGEIENRWLVLRTLLRRWHAYVKLFEQQDDLVTAHAQGRLHIRWIRDGIEKVWPGIQAKPDFAADNQTYAGRKLDVGVMGINRRLDPRNLSRERRIALGLHSLSGSLVDPSQAIFKNEAPGRFRQIHTWTPEGHWFSFAALLPVADQALVIRLYEIVESTTRRDIIEGIEWFLHRITHAGYAYPTDMGMGYLALFERGAVAPCDFEYVPKTCKSLMGPPASSIGDIPMQRRVCRGYAAAYPLVIAIQPRSKTEVTIEYREHAGPFPLFAKYDHGQFVQHTVDAHGAVVQLGNLIGAEDTI